MISMLRFTDTINIGAIVVGLIVLGGIAYIRIRAGVGDVWRNVASGHEERANLLAEQLHQSTELIGEQKLQIARLEALPNLERIITVMAESTTRSDDRADTRLEVTMAKLEDHDHHLSQTMIEHENRAQDRHDKQMSVMETMKETLVRLNHET